MRIDGNNRPDERDKDQHDVNCGQEIVFQSELQRGERKIENQIEDVWQDDQKWNLFFEIHPKNFPEKDGDQDIEKSPHRTKNCSRW